MPYVTLHGRLSQKSRDAAIRTFMSQPPNICKVLVSQTEVGGFGLNLPQASNIIYYSLSFSLINFIQSQDRIHRIGQTLPCRYFVLLAENTIDLYIYKKILKGVELSEALLDKREIEELKEVLYESSR
jgi:SNF2 family DNA or RNA helicase